MGAINIELKSHGKTMKEAFDNAVSEAIYYHGHDPYSGGINNCDLVADRTREYEEANNKDEFIDHLLDIVDKREVYGMKIKPDTFLFIGWAPY